MAKKNKKEQEPQYYMSAVNNPVLNYGVYVMKPMEKLLYAIMLIGIGGVAGLIFYGGLFKENGVATLATTISNGVVFGVVGLMACKIFMPTVTGMLHNRRLKALRTQFRDFLAALTTSLSSGMNFIMAVQNARSDLELQHGADSFIVKEVDEMLSGANNNIPIEDMIADFGRRSHMDDISNFSIVFNTCYRTGGNLKEIIQRTSNIISQKVAISDEIETKLTSNKMQMYIMLAIPPVLVLMMKFMSAEFAASFGSVLGVIAITISVGMYIAAYRMGRKITDIK